MEPNLVESVLEFLEKYASTLALVVSGIGTILVVMLRQKFDRAQRREEHSQSLEAALRDERLEIYGKIIDPYILIFSKDDNFANSQKYRSYRNKSKSREVVAQEIITSVDYRDAGFKLALYGSDAVVQAYNKLMQHAYENQGQVGDPQELFKLLGEFLLAIRKSVGNESTKLEYHEMFEGFLSDIDSIRSLSGEKSIGGYQ